MMKKQTITKLFKALAISMPALAFMPLALSNTTQVKNTSHVQDASVLSDSETFDLYVQLNDHSYLSVYEDHLYVTISGTYSKTTGFLKGTVSIDLDNGEKHDDGWDDKKIQYGIGASPASQKTILIESKNKKAHVQLQIYSNGYRLDNTILYVDVQSARSEIGKSETYNLFN